MNLYRDEAGHWTGTQADAKLTGARWASVDIPTDKYGLLSWLNNMERELRDSSPPPVVLEPVQVSVQSREIIHAAASPEEVLDELLECDPQIFGRYLNATIDRLGALRNEGFDALAVLRRQVRSFPSRAATERGLGYFLLGDVE